jgi:hypothetical protein
MGAGTSLVMDDWPGLLLLIALQSTKWLGLAAGLVLFLALLFLAHLYYQLVSRWRKLKEAAHNDATMIKKRRQGPTWDAQEILPGIWLGSFPAAIKDDELRRRNITHVLSIGAEFKPVYPEQFSYLVAFAMDCPGQNILNYFEHTNRFIDSALASGSSILVHCQAGVSRSATLVAAYLVAQQGVTWTQALNSIKTIRPCIGPNLGFRKQLQSWEHTVNGNPNEASIRRWALSGVSVDGFLAQYDQAKRNVHYIIGNRLKDHYMRLWVQAILSHGPLLVRTEWGQRYLVRLLGQN